MKRVRKASPDETRPPQGGALSLAFAGAFGALLGLSLLKFGNPIILDRLIDPPANIWEYLFQPWPVRWGYAALTLCVGLLLASGTWRGLFESPKAVPMVLAGWFAWQLVASFGTADPSLTKPTIVHFGASVACFFAGLLGLARLRTSRLFWIPLLLAFAFVLWTGFEQHYGGLEATRRMFYEQPNWREYSPDYIKKIQSNRIFSTLVYPNALAGAILLLLPPLTVNLWKLTSRLRHLSRLVLLGLFVYGAGACLFWSGSKSGWLIALAMILAVLLRQPLPKPAKLAIIASVLVLGLAAFYVKYSGYFGRGAPSVSARFEYWKAAARTALENPILGTGPGTFSLAYRKIKPPDAEMAQLAHNDYLEQASDSGWIGFLLYASFICGGIVRLPQRCGIADNDEAFAVWLGLLGWSLQSLVEFPLYIPALAWTAFAFFGWLWGKPERNNEFDRGSAACYSAARQ